MLKINAPNLNQRTWNSKLSLSPYHSPPPPNRSVDLSSNHCCRRPPPNAVPQSASSPAHTHDCSDPPLFRVGRFARTPGRYSPEIQYPGYKTSKTHARSRIPSPKRPPLLSLSPRPRSPPALALSPARPCATGLIPASGPRTEAMRLIMEYYKLHPLAAHRGSSMIARGGSRCRCPWGEFLRSHPVEPRGIAFVR